MIYMASTKIETSKTALEIMSLLGKTGAQHIMTSYEKNEIVGLSFIIVMDGKEIPYKLPLRWEAVLDVMKKDRLTPNSLCNESQARRTAWRQILRWIQSQIAFIETGQVQLKEIFLPYILLNIKTGETLYSRLETNKYKLIE